MRMPARSCGVTDVVGDNDGLLEVGETWAYTAAHTVTQAEIDSNGGGDGDIDNIATAVSTETGPDTDDATVPVAQAAALNIVKERCTGRSPMWRRWIRPATPSTTRYGNQHRQRDDRRCGGHDDNLTPGVPGDDFNPAFSGGDTDTDGLLDVGETWTYTAAHTVTQAEIDSRGGPGQRGDGDRHRGDLGHRRRDGAGGAGHGAEHRQGRRCRTSVDAAGDTINYTITVANTGNTTMTGVVVTDDTECRASRVTTSMRGP